MTTESRSAPELRRLIADVYLVDDPPPGESRASWLTAALVRLPEEPTILDMARDFLEVIDLHRRLLAATEAARAAGDPTTALVLLGLAGYAEAALVGSTGLVGWRAAALDLLEPDDAAPGALDRDTATRLLALALEADDGIRA